MSPFLTIAIERLDPSDPSSRRASASRYVLSVGGTMFTNPSTKESPGSQMMATTWYQLSAQKLLKLCALLMDGHIQYGFNSKHNVHTDPKDIKAIDCSSLVRYVLYGATDGQLILPDGSWHQQKWCEDQELEEVAYPQAGCQDGWLRIAFIPVGGKRHPGHVWLILNGETIESHSHKGPDRRPWDAQVLWDEVSSCFKLAQTEAVQEQPKEESPVMLA